MTGQRISIFPLSGAVLYPGLQLPLHIFEPRYRALVSDALARDRLIGMIQPQRPVEDAPLYSVGCLGRIGEVEALNDGRFNILLTGESRFRIVRELEVTTPFRQVEAELIAEAPDEVLAPAERALLEGEGRDFARVHGYRVNWEQVMRLDDATFVNATAQIVPFDAAAKQGLLEASTLSERCRLLVDLLRFFGRRDSDDGQATLQ